MKSCKCSECFITSHYIQSSQTAHNIHKKSETFPFLFLRHWQLENICSDVDHHLFLAEYISEKADGHPSLCQSIRSNLVK